MQISILSVSKEYVKTAKGGYNKAEVAYKDESGKVQGKKIMSFSNQKVFDLITAANTGDSFDIKSEKDDNGYWQWTAASPANGITSTAQAAPTETTGKGYSAPKSNYETAEERAKKQVYIVRQSSITSAIALTAQLKDYFNKSNDCPADIMAIAKRFEAYVLDKEVDDGSLEAMKGDEGEVF